MRDLSEQCGILTGATSGVGRALAKLLAERGTRLVISGRRESRLIDLASEYPGVLIPLPGDITNSRFQEELVEKAQVAFGGIDLVIAAAGVGAVGPFSESSLDTMRSVFEIDFFAPIDLVYQITSAAQEGAFTSCRIDWFYTRSSSTSLAWWVCSSESRTAWVCQRSAARVGISRH